MPEHSLVDHARLKDLAARVVAANTLADDDEQKRPLEVFNDELCGVAEEV